MAKMTSKTRKQVAIIGTMALSSALFIILIVVGVYSSSSLDSKELLLVHVISRHGARTPVDTYPNDPHINETFYPVGWGQLTNEGKNDMFNVGKCLRERYNFFLGDLYAPDIYYAQSTDVDRTIASAQLINAGIWEPNHDQKWSHLNWQPVPVHYEPLDDDMLLLVRKTCAQYEIALRNVTNSKPIQDKLKLYQELLNYLEVHTGSNVKDFDDLLDLYSTLYAEYSFNLTLPSWTEGIFPHKIYEPTAFSFKLRAYNSLLTRLKGGVLLRKIINDWLMKKNNIIVPKDRKLFMYVGHDSTIANLLSALKIFKTHIPDYAATIILEFSRDRFTNVYGIEVFYKMSTHHQLQKIHLPDCEEFCLLDDFLRNSYDVIPKDWESECYSDDPSFVPSEPVGP